MPDYSKGLIYMLRHKDDINEENIYIGSTTNFIQRKKSHKSHCNNPNDDCYNQKKYQYIRANGGWENWVMEWIEDYPCKSKRELGKREGELTKGKAKLNLCIAGRSGREWQKDNVEKCRNTSRRFYYNNLEKERERARNVYEKYKHLHREKRNEKQKQIYQDNKEKYNAISAQKITCECGTIVRKGDIAKHKRTGKHIKLMENKNVTNN